MKDNLYTHTYMTMCEQSAEIQLLWDDSEPIYDKIECREVYTVQDVLDKDGNNNFVYCPNASALLRMLGQYPLSVMWMEKLKRFFYSHDWYNKFVVKTEFTMDIVLTWEMLLLCFVMYDKCGKEWTGSEWVKENSNGEKTCISTESN